MKFTDHDTITWGKSKCVHLYLEGFSEVLVESGVDDRVEERVGVSQPQEERGHPGGDGRGRVEGPHQRQHEEGQPAHDESAHDDA